MLNERTASHERGAAIHMARTNVWFRLNAVLHPPSGTDWFRRQSRSPAQSNLQQKADISCCTFVLRVMVLAYAATGTFALSRMRKPTGAIVNCISSCAGPPSGVSKAMMSKSRRIVAIASLISSIAR